MRSQLILLDLSVSCDNFIGGKSSSAEEEKKRKMQRKKRKRETEAEKESKKNEEERKGIRIGGVWGEGQRLWGKKRTGRVGGK